MTKLDSDAILCFMGGVTPNSLQDKYRANHLSIGRVLQIYDLRDAGMIGSDVPILVGGGQHNYHTGKSYPDEPMSDATSRLLTGRDGFANVFSMEAGFDTASEAGAMLKFIKAHHPEWRKFTYNSDVQHYPRILVILQKFFGPEYSYLSNPLSNTANEQFRNVRREEQIIELFKRHFARYPDGAVPYKNDEKFYSDHEAYFREQRSIIEGTSSGPEDLLAYDGGLRRKI